MAVLEVAAADSLQGTCLFHRDADVAGDGQRLAVVVAGLLARCRAGLDLAEAVECGRLAASVAVTAVQRERVLAAGRGGVVVTGQVLEKADFVDRGGLGGCLADLEELLESFALGGGRGRVVRRNQCGKPGTQMMQLLICLAILLGLVAYFGAAVIALVQLILTRYTSEAGASAPMITWPQVVVIVGAVLGTLTPGLRRQWFTAAEQSLKMMRYLWVAGPRNSLRGEVLALIEHASERDEIGRISIVGFSFGSLVAIDTLFPASKAPTARMERVTSLATIGCPFDLVRMLQPHYYENRFAPDGQDRPWINIYDPVDVLGSNFRDDGKEGSASKGVTIRGTGAVRQPTGNIPWNSGQPLTLISGLMLASVRAHAQYWGPNPRAETALGLLAAELFCGTPTLR